MFVIIAVPKRYSARFVACRIAQCIGVGDPLAWEDGDKGPPFWEPDNDRWTLSAGNDHWLHLIREDEEFCFYKLNYRYMTEHRQEAFEGLVKWLECDLNFDSEGGD